MEPLNLFDYEELAREKLHPAVWAFASGGAGDGVTLRNNRAAFERMQLLPRVLRGVDSADTRTTALGVPISSPVMVAPSATHAWYDAEGELATARASGGVGTVMVVSTMSSFGLEEISVVATDPLWFQLYIFRGRRVAEQLVRRAESAGYRAIILTVDTPRPGRKEAFRRIPGDIPPEMERVSLDLEFPPEDMEFAALSWDDVEWLVSRTELPIVLKGVLSPEDAKRAVDHGVAGIVVSNHGGQQLDGVPASIEALPEVAETVGGEAEIYLDGGVRRGTDVLKALALGARAVMVGRPVLWGLAAGGESGARNVLDMLRAEFEEAMVLAGAPDAGSIRADLVRRK